MDRDRSMDIAVIGISARFPGPKDLDKWWSALIAGQVLTTRYERNSLLEHGVSQELLDDPDYIPVHGHLADADRFDNQLFRISPREAELMDPQHRLMLEVAWEALEDAGCGKSTELVTGVFASRSSSSYMRSMLANGPLDPDTLEHALHATEPDFIAGLIAYKLDLKGPAVAVQTACSSSLVSVHFAVQALLNGDCDQALVVAAGICFPQAGYLYVPGGIKSASGVCRPFDQCADGVVEGSGVACLVLRRLSDALRDGPEPHGIILGTAINNDGAAKAGYFAPSVSGQISVIKAAVNAANVDASSIGYLETHGTGTHIGDPIEWTAASEAYKTLGAQPGQIAVGALKANIGHLDAAAGIASLIKALRVVKEGLIPPMVGFDTLNSFLEVEGPLFVPNQGELWTTQYPRRAAISAFGIGGTNAHIIIEQPPAPCNIQAMDKDSIRILTLSAADSDTLTRASGLLSSYLINKQVDLDDVTFTLVNGRKALSERLVVCGHTSREITKALTTGVGLVLGHAPSNGLKPVIFGFPGQGSQYPGMALPFAAVMPGFSRALEYCLSAFEPGIRERVSQGLLDSTFSEIELNETELAQPALFALEYAIAKSLIEIGVTPSAVIGHSLGEITAACLAGAFDLHDAAHFIVARGRAMQACPKGSMLAVGCDVTKMEWLMAESKLPLSIAAINTSEMCVIAGEPKAIEAFRKFLGKKIFSKLLKTNRAFHSALIEPALQDMDLAVKGIRLQPLCIPIALNATGKILEAGSNLEEKSFLVQARHPVQFAEGLTVLDKRFPDAILVEVGAGRTLSSMAACMQLKTLSLSPSRTDQPDKAVLKGIGALWTLGYPIKLSILSNRGRLIHLPTYPFFGPRWMAPEAAAGLQRPPKVPEQLPFSAKIDQSAAITMDRKYHQDVTVVLTGLWTDLLNYREINEHSDFFELGGDSLLMVSLVRKVNRAFDIQAPPRAMLSARTFGRQMIIIRELLLELIDE